MKHHKVVVMNLALHVLALMKKIVPTGQLQLIVRLRMYVISNMGKLLFMVKKHVVLVTLLRVNM